MEPDKIFENEAVLDNLSLLCRRGQELSSIVDLDTVLNKTMETACEICRGEAASLMLLDKKTQELYFKVTLGKKVAPLRKIRLKLSEGIAGWVATHKKALIVNNAYKDPRHLGKVDQITNFVTRNLICVPILWEGEIVGVIEVINKKNNEDFDEKDIEYLTILANQSGASITVTSNMDKLHNFFINMLEIFMMSAETLGSMQGHSIRVARLATKLAREIGVDDDLYKDIYYACLIHEIGKIKLSREQLLGGERQLPQIGAEMVRPIKLLRRVADLIEAHDEKWDGSGYPKGLKGEEIPLGSRIISLAEDYEEYKEEEAYRKTYDPYFQGDFMRKIEKTHDPQVVAAFVEVRRKDRERLEYMKSTQKERIKGSYDYLKTQEV